MISVSWNWSVRKCYVLKDLAYILADKKKQNIICGYISCQLPVPLIYWEYEKGMDCTDRFAVCYGCYGNGVFCLCGKGYAGFD